METNYLIVLIWRFDSLLDDPKCTVQGKESQNLTSPNKNNYVLSLNRQIWNCQNFPFYGSTEPPMVLKYCERIVEVNKDQE